MKTTHVQQELKTQQPRLLAFIRKKVNGRQDAEDLTQEVFLQALSNLNALESVDNLAAWLFTVARNKIIDSYRRKKLPTVSINETTDNGLRFEDILAADIPDEWDDDTRGLVADAVADAIDELPKKQHYVFVEQVIHERPFRELSEESGESINTLLARKRYAVQFLQKRLNDIKTWLEE